jgi:hypothetical protein
MKNLSFIFTPALFHDHNQTESVGEWYSDKVLEDLIVQHESLFVNVETKTPVTNSPTASVLSLSFSVGERQASIARHPTVLKAPASIPSIHTTTTTTTTTNSIATNSNQSN